ncbi:hypothetical protein IIA28_17570 [candidate division KSB1 bacterium]|nr:hypothetical protein [candidate division KSB1 bacterium]
MPFTKFLIVNLLTLVLLVDSGVAQPLVQKLNATASVDWSRQVILTSGSSSSLPPDSDASQRIAAIERAKAAAVENLFKAIKELPLDAHSKVKQALENKLLSTVHISQVVQKYTIVDTRSMSDMSVEIDVELPLIGNLLPLLFPKDTHDRQLIISDEPLCPTCLQLWPEGKTVPGDIKLIVPSEGLTANKGTPFTGLIIDVRGLNFKPTLNPTVVNSANEEIYSLSYVDREVAARLGIVNYQDDLRQALKNGRVGRDPLVVRGVQVTGPLSSNIIISANDAILIHAAAKTRNFLKKCKVIILVG